jgi:hypothetical protein
MIYIGNFKFVENGEKEQESRHGFFTCLVEAKNAEKALEVIGTHLLRTKKSGKIFANTSEIYLDEMIGVSKAPKKSVITNFRIFTGELKPSVSWVLPEGSFTGINMYEWLPSDEEPGEQTEGSHAVKPFVRF